MRDVLTMASSWCRDGERVALARVIAARGSAPRPVGAALAISASGKFAGSVSGGCVEGAVIQAAAAVVADDMACTLHFSGDADPLTEIVLGCGGEVTIYVERIDQSGELAPVFAALLAALDAGTACAFITDCTAHPAHWLVGADEASTATDVDRAPDNTAFVQRFAAPGHLVIVGADAVAQALVAQAQLLEWRIIVIDPRAAWLTPQRFPTVTRVSRWPDVAIGALTVTPHTAIVVLSHDPKIDEPALRVALRSAAGYVGALGSRTAHDERLMRLHVAGITVDQLARLHAPIGLDLGSSTPAEIALSVMAEIVATRNGRDGGALKVTSGPIHAQV